MVVIASKCRAQPIKGAFQTGYDSTYSADDLAVNDIFVIVDVSGARLCFCAVGC